MQRLYTNNKIQYKENAYLTVYLSLVFGIVLSLLLALIEGASIAVLRTQADIVADLGMDSVFAEYNREILEQYELFFIDSSYGEINGGIGMVEEHLSDYMGYNINPSKDIGFSGEKNLLNLINPYIEIKEVSYASDESCLVWKTQAVNYMKSVYGKDIVSTVKEHIDTVNINGLTTIDVAEQIAQEKEKFENELTQKGIIEYGAESEEGYSYEKVSGLFDRLVGGGLLTLVMPSEKSLSGAVADSSLYFSSRMKKGMINKGVGVHKNDYKADGIIDELIYGEYIMKMYGNFIEPKNEGLLKYQTEYILFGKNSDVDNIRSCVEMLFAVRAAANLISIYNDSAKKTEAEIASIIICTLLAVPELADTLTFVLLGIWALAETASDVNKLLDGEEVPLIKKESEWNIDISKIFAYDLFSGNKKMTGMSYQDYLRVFLGIMDKDTKAVRSMDIVEMDIQKTKGNEKFRIDRCIDYIRVGLGFEDSKGHGYLFDKIKCYE